MEKLYGVVEHNDLAKGIVRVNGREFVASDRTRAYAATILKGQTVELTVDENGSITFIRASDAPTDTPPPTFVAPKGSLQSTPLSGSVTTRDVSIIRQNALAHADAWLRFFSENPDVRREETDGLDEMMDGYFRFAERCEKWVLR